jgi:hypothetical protein
MKSSSAQKRKHTRPPSCGRVKFCPTSFANACYKWNAFVGTVFVYFGKNSIFAPQTDILKGRFSSMFPSLHRNGCLNKEKICCVSLEKKDYKCKVDANDANKADEHKAHQSNLMFFPRFKAPTNLG